MRRLHASRGSSPGPGGQYAENVPPITPLFDPADPDSMMFARARVAVLLLVTSEVRSVISPDIVAHPSPGGDEVGRVLTTQVHENPKTGLGGIIAALGSIPRKAGMP
jgi:hypothetical protein